MVKVPLSVGAPFQARDHFIPHPLTNAVCCFELHLFTALFQMQLKKMGYSAPPQVRSQVLKMGIQETNM